MDLSSKRALVTGAASGIGAELVAALTAGGATVVAADVNEAALQALADSTACTPTIVDVTSEEANRTMVADAVESLGGLDLVFLNAGVLGRTRDEMGSDYKVGDLDLEQYRKVSAVNTDGVIYGTVAAAAAMTDGGAIVCTASAAGLVPWEPTPFYCAGKHAVVGWVRATAPALASQNITMNAICPGGVATALLGMTAEVAEQAPDMMLHPSQVASAAIGAATDGGTGRALSVVAGRDEVVQEHPFNAIPDFP